MKHVIPMRRMLRPRLIKSVFNREGAPRAGFHKYIKRERAYVGGKLVYRYWYADDMQRKAGISRVETDSNRHVHEHRLIGEIKAVHPNLAGVLPTATESPTERLRGEMSKAPALKFAPSDHYTAKHVEPYVKKEKEGENTGRDAPNARLLKAIEMIPDHIKELLSQPKESEGAKIDRFGNIPFPGLKLVSLREPQNLFDMTARAWANPKDGELAMLDNSTFDRPMGDATFGGFGNFTGTETTYWHEIGHFVHFAAVHTLPEAMEEWANVIHNGPEPKIRANGHKGWWEDFADSFSCAIGHPKELAQSSPARYDFMREHFLPDMPEREDVLKASDEEFAWWEGDIKNNASKLLKIARRERAPRYHPYYSEKDQFYVISVGGRNVHLRIGPASKDAEDGWERMPDTIDPETGLPVQDVALGQRMRATGTLKEIYDEHGNPLTDKQAFFLLAQGDEEGVLKTIDRMVESAFKGGEDLSVDSYDKWLARKNPETGDGYSDTHSLAYKMYISFGSNAKLHTQENERKRVAKVRSKGGDPVADRHWWVPVEVSRDEFYQKSGTFKYGDLRSAPVEDQPWRELSTDPKTGKRAPVSQVNPITAEIEPSLTARVYTQENPDGTSMRIEVNESFPFRAGDRIEVPDGKGGWKKDVVLEGQEDVFKLARDYKTTARALLSRNGRFEFGQIMNPVLAALLNPGNKVISDEAALQNAMREAASLDPPANAWVSIRSSGDAGAGIAHIHVQFDGSGPPRVLGDYWKRITGIQDLRIDQLVDAKGNLKFKIPAPVERAPKKQPVRRGGDVWFVDPKSNVRLLGVYAGTKGIADEKTGKTSEWYAVQPYGRQVAGASKKLVYVRKVEAADEDMVVGQPSLRKRLVQPLKDQLLLYADEVKRKSGPWDATGRIRIALPSDGSISWDTIAELPGVQVESTSVEFGGQSLVTVTGATVAPHDIDVFRARLGGFVMDQRVQSMLDAQGEQQRMMNAPHKDEFLVDSDFEDADGNVNPDGILKGLTTGADGIQPARHRMDALKKLAANGGRMMAAHFMGCVSGDTVINVNRARNGFKLPIRVLFGRFNNEWDDAIPAYAQSLFGEHVRLNEILNVVESGVQETFELRTKSGRSIRATAMHPFWTPTGWVSLGDLREGDQVGVMGLAEPRGRAPKTYKYPYRTALYKHPFAGVRGAATSPYRVPTHRLVVEAHLNGLELEAFVLRCRNGDVEGLQFIDPKTHAVHHLDENTLNNTIENLEVLTHEDHWRKHGEQTGWTNFNQFRIAWDEVVFVGDEKHEPTFDICMHVDSQSYVGNDFIIHNTGKTALAIMASAMMRNLTDPENKTKPHANRMRKKCLIVVPLNTTQNWYQEFKRFTGAPPTLLGSASLAGAQQIPMRPARIEGETDEVYEARMLSEWKEAAKDDPKIWNPWVDGNANITVGFEYFRDHADQLRALKQIDGMVVDEAHKIMRENTVSNEVEKFQSEMKMFLAMTGTPITNTLNVIPRLLKLVSGGRVDLGTVEEFEKKYLVPSAVLRSYGKQSAARTDLNPMTLGKLTAAMQPYIHVATIADVIGKTMPTVLLDENNPAHLIGQQARLVRAAMAQLTEADRKRLEESAAMGIDEELLLSEDARRRVAVARSFANSLGYKPPDARETVSYEVEVSNAKGQTKIRFDTFVMPDYQRMTGKHPHGFAGQWPSHEWVEKGWISQGEYNVYDSYSAHMFGVPYDKLAGTAIDPGILAAMKKSGTWESPTGVTFPSTLKNPDYGPEGVMARGYVPDETSGKVEPLKGTYFDSVTGKETEFEVAPGKRFVRDPNKKASGLYYDFDDWDSTGRLVDKGEGSGTRGGLDGEDDEEEEKDKKGPRNEQRPKKGLEEYNLNRHPARRKQRAMMDAAFTTGNAKTDKLEEIMLNTLNTSTGGGSKEQIIVFGNRIGSSVRCAEAKMRTLGYMDVNEALGRSGWSTDHDKARALGVRKFFVTYMGASATLGDRDINSEIFRRQQDQFGKDTGVSMFVWRSLYGGSKPPAVGVIKDGWSRSERQTIAQQFHGGYNQATGKESGLELPLRVSGRVLKDGSVGQVYVYESELPAKARAAVRSIEDRMRSAVGPAFKALEAEMSKTLEPYWTERLPLTQAQMDIFNNTQVMVASDAANVGLNWPANTLVMYDSLFSPMEEWQRISRAARMLPSVVSKEWKPVIDEMSEFIEKREAENGLREYGKSDGTAMLVIRDALEALSPENKERIKRLPGSAPDQVLEAFFAKRALDKLAKHRVATEESLRRNGAVPDPDKPSATGNNFIPPAAIQALDVVNDIIRRKLTPFEREMLRARRYLVDVKRLTVSADMPVMKQVGVRDVETGKRKTISVHTGEWKTESPILAERSQLAQGRAKMVPNEYALKVIQNEVPVYSQYDFVVGGARDFAQFSALPEGDPEQHSAVAAQETKKARPPARLVVMIGGKHASA